jgi:indolepyruvate ferredoxin oxidoreductase
VDDPLSGGRLVHTLRAVTPSTSDLLPIGREVTLADRYRLAEGTVLSTGVQAAVRVVLDQMRSDARAGMHTAAFVSGYRGSPLGGLDQELGRQRELRRELDVVHRPALNEELGATSVWGTQVIERLPGPRVEGVLGVWYGKAPGVHRAADALRHGNFVGAHPKGGLLALCGDDPQNKSSTLPSASESTLAGLDMPVVFPGNPQEVLDLGLHAVALSRASGLWTALKLVTSVADGVASISVGPGRVNPQMPQLEFDGRPYVHRPTAELVAPASNEMERTLYGVRLDLAREYARHNPLNQIVLDPGPGTPARLGLVAAGPGYYDLREALHMLGLGERELLAAGVRILKLGMIWPLERDIVTRFGQGLEEIVVVESKGPFIESAVRDVLYGMPGPPRVLGREDERSAPLLPGHGELDAGVVVAALGPRLERLCGDGQVARRLAELDGHIAPRPVDGLPVRMPAFCSGCPHNRSTDAADGQLIGGGIGCHSMIAINPAGKGTITGLTQMGAEGAQWLGQAPFVDAPHLTQNMGDGTFSHSGSLAIRAAVDAAANITYKLLYNRAVAMTGGQEIEGLMSVPVLTRWLEAEGVTRTIVTTDEPERYRGVALATNAEVRDRSALGAAQAELAGIPGVTVLIHDQGCAAELRRLRKRGRIAERASRVVINERVCEGCGDCGRKSHCLSVIPVDTEFGVKTQIHQASCNTDYSCLEGDCPSFVRVTGAIRPRAASAAPPAPEMPEPAPAPIAGAWTVRMIGIGGTGVVTVAQILGMAALLDGLQTIGLDQTGLAQKGGPVVSDIRLLAPGDCAPRANRASRAGADAYLGFDLLGAANPANLAMADPGHTIAIVSTSEAQTASMVGQPSARFSSVDRAVEAINARTDGDRALFLDAQALAEALFADSMAGNMIVLGAAWQRGALPISRRALREAISLNGVSVQQNLAAFEWGRATVADPDALAAISAAGQRSSGAGATSPGRMARLIAGRVAAPTGSALARVVGSRVDELIAYQSATYANRYAGFVESVRRAEQSATPGASQVSEAVARHLYKLMAYKDEYEVARLHLDPEQRARVRAEFGSEAKIQYLLHPPLLRALGMQRKLALGEWFDPVFAVLRAMRRLRGTPLDVFGFSEVRRVERALVDEYRELVTCALPHLAGAPAEVLAACELPDVVRGYEHVKLETVQTFRARAQRLHERFAQPD